jgi:hypothetical protein
VKCVVCFIVIGKDLILCPKSNTFDKHVGKKKVTMVLPHLGVKKYEWFVNKRCQHLKNVIMYMNMSRYTIIEQVKVVENNKNLPQYFIFFNKGDLY